MEDDDRRYSFNVSQTSNSIYHTIKNQRGQSNFTQSNTKSQIPFDILFGRSINHMAYNNKTNSKIKNSKQKITNSNNF